MFNQTDQRITRDLQKEKEEKKINIPESSELIGKTMNSRYTSLTLLGAHTTSLNQEYPPTEKRYSERKIRIVR